MEEKEKDFKRRIDISATILNSTRILAMGDTEPKLDISCN